ncbi:MAG TPA: DNA polymerase III subunit delta [Bacteroidales bacterium]|jgi:DNA polymerase-3 subunit delta'|nr:DNA polymerase III subunit delta [Bacteroidales bacterium]
MKFSDIPGQKEIIQRLIGSVKTERVSHAQLFTGPEGCGNLALALAYAQYISCENKTSRDSCGTCKSCIKYEKLIHPDLHFVFPVIRNKASAEPVSDNYMEQWREFVRKSPYFTLNKWLDSIEVGNAQGLIFASEASEILRKLSLKAFESDFKIMIIWLPEKMHPSSANKLLKLIEEPPEKTLFILVSDEPDKVIPTILSRCQLVKIPSFRCEEISSFLVDTYRIHKAKADDIAGVVNGNIIRAVELCENEDTSLKNLDYFKTLMRFAWKRDIVSIINWSEEMAAIGREPQKSFLSFALRLLRENLMLTLGQKKNSLVYLTGEESEFSSKFHPFINQENIYSFSEEINKAYSHIEANGNARIIFLDLGLRITRLIVR